MIIDKIAWLHLPEGRALLARSRGQDRFYFPGGKPEPGETDEQALLREIEEELTVRLRPETLRFLGAFEAPAHGQPAGTLLRMRCYAAEYEGTLHPAAEIEEMAWLTYQDRPRVSAMAQQLFDWLRQDGRLAD